MSKAGVSIILLYTVFTAISLSHLPNSFSPLFNFLSQLGNSNLNPDGAIFYNLAVILAGLAAIPFYISLIKWCNYKTGKKIPKTVLAVGLLNALSVMMVGIYTESVNFNLHVLWSIVIFSTFVPILIIVNKLLLNH